MFGSDILETAIGLSLIYLVLSSVCSAARELLESIIRTRAVGLERGIAELLQDQSGTGLTKALYEHPLINGLFFGSYAPKLPRSRWMGWLPRWGNQLPSYIPSRNFSAALFDLVVRGGGQHGSANPLPDGAPLTMENLRAAAVSIQNETVQRLFVTAIDQAGNDVGKVRKQVEDWFDMSMNRMSGWYKRQTQYVLFLLAVLVSIAANADSLALIRHLSSNTVTRQTLVAQAHSVSQDQAPLTEQAVRNEIDALSPLQLPLGWNGDFPQDGWGWAQRIFGWLITALAVSLGAPFWFDMLGKFMSVRASFKPKDAATQSSDDAAKAALPQVLMLAPAATPATPAAATPAAFTPHRWASGDPQEGIL